LTVLWTRRFDGRNPKFEADNPDCLASINRVPWLISRHAVKEVETEQIVIVQEANNTHPLSGDSVWVLHVQICGWAQLSNETCGFGRDVGVGRGTVEWFIPYRLEDVWRSSIEETHIVAQNQHDGFYFFPVDVLAAIALEGSP
jgi:hypothetical protein